MVLEIATLNIRAGQQKQFEANFVLASQIIASMPGYISHQLMHCLENDCRYVLFVNWETLEDHTVGFRNSPQFQQWKQLVHQFFDPAPTVEHFEAVGISA